MTLKIFVFTKAEANFLKFVYSIQFKNFSWNFLKEKIRAEFSEVATKNLISFPHSYSMKKLTPRSH